MATAMLDPPKERTEAAAPEVIETRHPGLRFRRKGPHEGCLLIDEPVDLANVMAEAEEFGAVEPHSDTVYVNVEFTFGIHEKSGSGKRTEDALERMLEQAREYEESHS